MTPATQTRPKARDVLAERDRLGQAHAKAKADADTLRRDHFARLTKQRQLLEDRRRLTHNEPSLADHLGNADDTIKGNPVLLVDRKLEALSDLDDLAAQGAHAQRIADKAKDAHDEYVRQHAEPIVEAIHAEAREKTNTVNAGIAALAEQIRADHLRYGNDLAEVAAVSRRNTRVLGFDDAAALARQLDRTELRPPELQG